MYYGLCQKDIQDALKEEYENIQRKQSEEKKAIEKMIREMEKEKNGK